MTINSLFDATLRCLQCTTPISKVEMTHTLFQQWNAGELTLDHDSDFAAIDFPGRPDKPNLVDPRNLPRRSLSSNEGIGAFVHAIAHIEFNAINLALDAVYRFRDLPEGFYGDWLRVADDEARHFEMLSERMTELDWQYGDFDAHDGLWGAAMNSAHDPMVRMALVPRVFEARGLDVTPGMIKRLLAVGDKRTADILEIILQEEIAHVEAGTRWFRYLAAARDLEPDSTFQELLETHGLAGKRTGPMHREARLKAGFSESELDFV